MEIMCLTYRLLALALIVPALVAAQGYSLINCYGSLPSSYTKNNVYDYQSSGYCYNACKSAGATYFALHDHNACYCGSVPPSGSTSSQCNAYCLGFGSEMCGGISAYSFYRIDGVEESQSSDLSSSSSSTRSKSTSSISSSKSTSISALTGLNIAATSSSSISGSSTTNSESAASSSSSGSATLSPSRTTSEVPLTSIIYSTELHTQGGSTVYVTNTIVSSATASPTDSNSSNNRGTNGKGLHKKVNVGAIVGGVVGGVVGALAIAVASLLIMRRNNMRREQERMEKEYQEAIKPVEYPEYPDNLYASSISSHRGPSSGSFDKERLPRSTSDPFDDTRRVSNGSILDDSAKNHVLTVVNPDSDD